MKHRKSRKSGDGGGGAAAAGAAAAGGVGGGAISAAAGAAATAATATAAAATTTTTTLQTKAFPTELDEKAKARIEATKSEAFERSFSREEKRKLGKTCKLLLDLGRAEHLRCSGYDAVRLLRYTTRSKEDVLLLAKACK